MGRPYPVIPGSSIPFPNMTLFLWWFRSGMKLDYAYRTSTELVMSTFSPTTENIITHIAVFLGIISLAILFGVTLSA